MGFPRSVVLCASVVGIASLAILSRPQESVRAAEAVTTVAPLPDSQTTFQAKVMPLLEQNCFECHANGKHKGDVALDSFKTVADVEKKRGQWEQVLRDVHYGDMPIAEAKHKPTFAERKIITDWIERELYNFDPAHPYPGRTTIHRLNRSEYNNTMRDLLATDMKPADAFPVDDGGYGFDNNGDVLSVAPILMEKYVEAAGVVLDKAIYSDPVVPPPLMHVEAATLEGTVPKSDPKAALAGRGGGGGGAPVSTKPNLYGRLFDYAGSIYTDYNFPADGTYNLRFRGYGKQRPIVQFQLDGKDVGQPISITEDMPNSKVYGIDHVKLPGGQHRLSLVFTNGATKEEYDVAVAKAKAAAAEAAAKAATQPSAVALAASPTPAVADDGADVDPATLPPPARAQRPPPQAVNDGVNDSVGASPAPAPTSRPTTNPAGRGRGGGGARGAAGARGGFANARGARGARGGRGGPAASITGKSTMGAVFIEAEGPTDLTPERMSEAYRRVFVAYPSATVTKAQAAEAIIRNFAAKAFRRPVEPDEVTRLMDVWSSEDAHGEPFEASIHTTLQAVLVSPYFLYRYEQDPAPTDVDGVRKLDEYELASRLSYFLWSSMPDDQLISLASQGKLRENLESEVRRMMADPKSFAMVENFAGQWLQLRQLNNVSPDPKRYPTFDESLRAAMLKETQLFFCSIMTEDRSILDFIDSDYTFMNEQLAHHYGRTDIVGDQFRRVTLTGNQRGGLLTQASILTITSYSNRTSPVQRGKWVLENLLDAAPPPPPPDVPKLVETEQAEMTGTMRQRMEEHRTNPNCITCHSQMDPIGFGLENYDAIGAWRDRDISNVVIDATGTLPDGSNFNGAPGLKQILNDRKDEFVRCLTDRLLTYALGRGTEVYDKPMEEEIANSLKDKDYKFSALVMQIVQCDAFQKRAIKRGAQ